MTQPPSHPALEAIAPNPILVRIRKFLFLALLLGAIGTSAELLLVGHTENALQWMPLALMALLVPVLVWHLTQSSTASIRTLQIVMVLFLIGGIVGLGAHWQSKLQFKRETNPSLAGSALFWEAMKSQSPPALAPGVFIQMALLGFAYAHRHPVAHRHSNIEGEE